MRKFEGFARRILGLSNLWMNLYLNELDIESKQ